MIVHGFSVTEAPGLAGLLPHGYFVTGMTLGRVIHNRFPVHTPEMHRRNLDRDRNAVRKTGRQADPNLHVTWSCIYIKKLTSSPV